MDERGLFIAGRWVEGRGARFESTDPATGATLWEGAAAAAEDIDQAVQAAREAAGEWAEAPLAKRLDVLGAFEAQLAANKPELAEIISRETGKPLWESLGEAQAMIGKIALSKQAYEERRAETCVDIDGARGAVRYAPHGVAAVLGPFNLPGHLPNGHIVPALLAGNAVVFKPSEETPLVGRRTAELWAAAGLPPGVLNLVQGGVETGQALVEHPGIDGVFFTGSYGAGQAIHRALADRPEVIVALEMGGNNPLIVWDAGDLDAAAYLTIQSAFLTSGQRCSCARRLIVAEGREADAFIERLLSWMRRVRIGRWTDRPEPFMGPVISRSAAEQVLGSQADARRRGGAALAEMRAAAGCPALLSPGLMDVTGVEDRRDEEIFGPFLQLIRVADFDAALQEANRTRYGLAAGLLSDNADLHTRFRRAARAGIVNWNRPLTGASSRLPFGGVGRSGNHRPSGYFAADYCSYPVASLEAERLELPGTLTPGIEGKD
ncbi:MAG: succinylglutamate-semialdehyde dehydrogenase [Candidatus Sumerlaeota bacterium]|nr:succinylglutamate-semialdehyde dehydrogenase [Candidatus Sumerlaeota bacterium]